MLASDRILLVRHGESTYNAEARLQGQADPPLTQRGRREAAALAPLLGEIPPERVICSDLVRARETAALLGHPDAAPDARWREIDVGEWAGCLLAELPQGDEPSWRAGPVVPPGGESWEELSARVADGIDALVAAGGPWLVVAHGGVVRAAVSYLMRADARRLHGPANGSVTVLSRARLLTYAWTPELSDRLPQVRPHGGV
jgi:probable phosphoglycerate mutase